eukprot:CAMPEP_0170213364 /NCGR_PEP_ID=MMETSP0116_2-20130129/6306_1 /TAXON_ID=400756 /ORGANISM="Durinskia baltica, Strain CSIRO CS-38" /LENGTH=503 /DNA_ID=CAMNT_0010463915 /DNA_START=21 /DNA_END=1532 /DNA_ORIENTATION=-
MSAEVAREPAAVVPVEANIVHGPPGSPKVVSSAWPLWKLILMALPQLGVQVLWCFIGPNSAPYMLHLGAGPSLATLNNIAGPITGFFTGPIVGALSDTLTSRWGRRRPVILAGLASTWVAGVLFASSEHLFSKDTAIFFAAPMYWVMDVTINILQTPHRALVADLASESQQVAMQVVFVLYMAVGNFIGFSIMQIYKVPVEHMLEYMLGICLLNTACILVQFSVARERPLKRDPDAPRQSVCAPVASVWRAVQASPRLLYHLAAVQCLVWVGNTSWNLYGGQWFADSVFGGNQHAPKDSEEYIAYGNGMAAFSFGGQLKSGLQLLSALAIIAILLTATLPPRLVYAPCIYVGLVVSICAAFFVGHAHTFAIVCMMLSIMPETGSFAIPFGLVATLNKHAELEGKSVSTALQMALLNCCVTIGQQICTVVLAVIESRMSLEAALPCIFMLAAGAQLVAGTSALFLNDAPPLAPGKADDSTSDLGQDMSRTSSDSVSGENVEGIP